ncbi:TIGR03619 family F420-dependent LLM class oxidoreductase [Catellatospora vulcania]|uniref:TIGR03619 family F420-dependent LLM class oxidoreductase n=1 Tax=Catellatospora vulcania TaxID=1460450 RepID=UPI0012D4242E|nr:TIGR03619 family F420-dependent LLM class oxidoreductase [Catellatospora vulcania]
MPVEREETVVKIGVHLGNYGASASAGSIAAFAVRAEELGFDSVWVSDHIAIPPEIASAYPSALPTDSFTSDNARNFWEAFAVLAFVAGMTRRVELGTSVIALPLRPPLLIAKQWATLDALSGGRAILGVSVGWLREEFDALGFGALFDQRGPASDEAIRILRSAWTVEGAAGFQGEVYRFEPVLMEPKPARAGGVPIWIGGQGRRAIRRAAELGDGWQPFRVAAAELAGHLAYLREQLDRYGRRREDVTVSVNLVAYPPGSGPDEQAAEWELAGDAELCAEKLRRYERAGVGHFLVNHAPGLSTAATLEAYEFVARDVRPLVEAR